MTDEKVLLTEYQHFSESFWRNEELGERRVNFFITLTTAVMAAVVALATSDYAKLSNNEIRLIGNVALFGLLLLGFMTFLRMLQRNSVTDEYKKILSYLREEMRCRVKKMEEFQLPFTSKKSYWISGGLAQTIGLINSFILALLTMFYARTPFAWLAALGAFIVSFLAHTWLVNRRDKSLKPITQTFRASVGAVIVNKEGQVLVLERSDTPDAWQMPQGGLEIGEAPCGAVKREILEETGIRRSDLIESTDKQPLLAYELPRDYRSLKTGRGQTQKWFLFLYEGVDNDIRPGSEFTKWKWTDLSDIVSQVVEFRKPVYDELQRQFGPKIELMT